MRGLMANLTARLLKRRLPQTREASDQAVLENAEPGQKPLLRYTRCKRLQSGSCHDLENKVALWRYKSRVNNEPVRLKKIPGKRAISAEKQV